ncbi:MAG: dienelactone hydrolase family protein [Chloroflexi bacterium]|nr:dienelactone hydrolase family protein [Chloroflexota bacterium]
MEIRQDDVHFPYDGQRIPGYLAAPAAPGKYPGLVVIQEWWGLVPHIREVADRFAQAGFVALAPDLYHGRATAEPDEARKLAMALDRQRAVAECSAAAAFLVEREDVSPKKAGVVGWCMGGGLSLSTAAHNDVIGAAVCFYGRPLEADDTARLRVPILGLYGEDDHGIPVGLVRGFEAALDEQGVAHEIVIYPGAPHAFFNDSRPGAFRPEAAADAWQRTLNWFHMYLN